jgi:hypothetical protein
VAVQMAPRTRATMRMTASETVSRTLIAQVWREGLSGRSRLGGAHRSARTGARARLGLGPNHVLPTGPPWRLGDETPPSHPKEEPDDIASQREDVS